MVIYEVTAIVAQELVPAYEKYMISRHILDLLATGFFSSAVFARSEEGRYRIHYNAHDKTSLDQYLEKDATRLRADFAQHFPNGVELSREIWEVLNVMTQ